MDASIKKVSFVEFERKHLFALVDRHKDVVQNRHTDSTTVHRKQLVWDRITHDYNRHPNVRRRHTKQLKRLWQNSVARSKRTTRGGTESEFHLDAVDSVGHHILGAADTGGTKAKCGRLLVIIYI